MNVVQADVAQGFQLLANRRYRSHEFEGVEHRHVEDFRDALALVLDFERVTVVALAAANLAGDVNVGQKMHLDADNTVALAGFAASALDVERKAARSVAAHPRIRQLREELTDRCEESGVGRGIRSRRAADRTLIDMDNLVEVLHAIEALDRPRAFAAAAEFLCERTIKGVEHQGRFARSRDAGHAYHHAERNGDGYIAQIVLTRAANRQPSIT